MNSFLLLFIKYIKIINCILKKNPKKIYFFSSVILLCIFGFFSGLYELAIPFMAEHALDKILPEKNITKFSKFTGLVASVYVMGWILGVLSSYVQARLLFKIPQMIKSYTFQKSLDNYIINLNTTASDYIISIENDASLIINSLIKISDIFFRSCTVIVFCLFITASKDVLLICLVFIFFTLQFIQSRIISLKLSKLSYSMRELSAFISDFLFDSLRKIKIINLFNVNNHFVEWFNALQKKRYFFDKKFFFIRKTDWFVSNALSVLYKVIIGYYLGIKLIEGLFTGGEVALIIILLIKLQSSFVQILNIKRDISSIEASIKRFLAIVEVKENKQIYKSFNEFGKLQFKNVSFFIGDKNIINNLSFDAVKGEKIIIFGKSGSGKTTIFNMLMGLLKPNKGEIIFDGINLNQMELHSFYERISIIPQDNELFRLSLLDNIKLGRNYNDDIIDDLLIKSQIKLLTVSKENDGILIKGEKELISKGEIRRVMLARGLLNNSQLIIMDEPDAHLGDETAYEIISRLFEIKDKTIIMLTHRESLMKLASKVIKI
ncbi:MAG: Type I secretion system ATPase subfamily protein [uncultured bacterium]|nr:MAG: Type I secretion system ATPase subfamily protein [uncultured bacterium]